MTDTKPRCKEMLGSDAPGYYKWRCTNNAKRDGYCGVHDPARRAERKRKRGPTKRERAEAQQARLEAVLKAARELVDWYVPTCGDGMFSDVDNLCKALDEYDRGEK